MRSYTETLSELYPGFRLQSFGDGWHYEQLVPAAGNALPDKATLDTQRLQLGRDRAWRIVQAERDRRKSNGVYVAGNWYHSDDSSRIQQLALVMMGANMPAGIQWKTKSGTFVTMTPQLAAAIFQGTAAQDMAIFAAAEVHHVAILSSVTPSTYDYSGGWPPTYTGA